MNNMYVSDSNNPLQYATTKSGYSGRTINHLPPLNAEKHEDPLAKRIKKDALWKPLLRSFRTWLRRLLSPDLDISKVFDMRSNVKPEVKEWCREWLKKVNAPPEVINSEHY